MISKEAHAPKKLKHEEKSEFVDRQKSIHIDYFKKSNRPKLELKTYTTKRKFKLTISTFWGERNPKF